MPILPSRTQVEENEYLAGVETVRKIFVKTIALGLLGSFSRDMFGKVD